MWTSLLLLVLSSLLGVISSQSPPPGYEGCKTIAIGDDDRGEDTYAAINRGKFYHPESMPLIYIKDSCPTSLQSFQLRGMLNKRSSRSVGNKTHPKHAVTATSEIKPISRDDLLLVRLEVTVCSKGKVPPAHVVAVNNYMFSPVVAICNNSTCGGCGRLWVSHKQYCSLNLLTLPPK